MKDHPKKGKEKAKLSRRDFLKAGAAGLGVAALGGLPEKVFGQAPAVKKGNKSLNSAGFLFHRSRVRTSTRNRLRSGVRQTGLPCRPTS